MQTMLRSALQSFWGEPDMCLKYSKILRLSIPKNPDATDVTFTVEACSDLTSWSSVGLVIETNTSTQLTVRDNVPSGPGVQRFMRVKVTRP